jgi:ABC-type multidrug transport system fused ATPase/permease subunit
MRSCGPLLAKSGGKTAIIIAHRISTVRQCDTIIVLENGRIAEQGPHESLIGNNGLYSTLYRLQHLQQGEDAMTSTHI